MKTMLSNLTAIAQNTQSDNIRMIDIDQLHESQANFFEVERIEEFAYTILGQGGVKDNLVVRPLDSGGYEIVSGHRRRAAVKYLLEHGESISRLLPCLIQSYSDEDSMMLDLILLNVSARQLSDQELWQSYENLNAILKRKKEAGEKFGRVREKIAEILGVSPSQVGKMQNVDRNAIEPVKEAVATGAISISTANVIAQLDEEQQEELASGDLSEVKPKEIKKVTPKVDTSSNFSDNTDIAESINAPTPERQSSPTHDTDIESFSADEKKHLQEYRKLLSWAQSLTREQIDFLCDGGWYNNTMKGYLIIAAKEAGFTDEQIDNLLQGLRMAFSKKNKSDADAVFQNR